MDQRKNDIQKNAPTPAVSAELYNNASCGLSRKEARSRYRAIGRNTLFDRDTARKKPFWFVIFKDPSVLFFLFLVLLALLFAPLSSGVLALIGFFCAVFYPLRIHKLHKRNEAAFDMLRMPRVCVIREGQRLLVPADRIVIGDLLSLKAGDIVPADCRLVAADRLRVLDVRLDDEGVFLRKIVTKRALPQELVGRSDDFDRAEDLLRGVSEILEGEALAVVVATGEDTCWRRETHGCDAPSEYHRAEYNAGCVERAADRALTVNTLIQFAAFFLFLIIRVLIYRSDEAGLVAAFMSLGALVGVGATSLLRALLSCFESRWREARMRSTDPQSRAILKSNLVADRLVGMTDVFVLGGEALALLQADPTSRCSLFALHRACAERGICLSVFLDEADVPASSFPEIAPTDILHRSDLDAKATVDFAEYIGKYRVFCGFGQENLAKLTMQLRRQKRQVALVSDRASDCDLLSIGSLAVGIADFSAALEKEASRAADNSEGGAECQASPVILRHADLLIVPTSRSACSILTLLSLREEGNLLLSRGMAAIRFLSLSQLSALFFIGFSCLFGLTLPTAFELLYGVGYPETVGLLWLATLGAPSCTRKQMRLGQRHVTRVLADPSFWAPSVITSFACVAVMLALHLFGVVTLAGVGAYLFCSLLFVQLCGLLIAAVQSGFSPSMGGFLLPSGAVLLPVLILSAFCVAFRSIDLLFRLGSWNVISLCLLPLAPVVFFVSQYLFLSFFHRTAK